LFVDSQALFRDLHHVVARDPYIAKTHVATAGGAIAAMALVFLNYGLAIYRRGSTADLLGGARDAGWCGSCGVVGMERSSAGAFVRGPWDSLPLLLGSFALGSCYSSCCPPRQCPALWRSSLRY